MWLTTTMAISPIGTKKELGKENKSCTIALRGMNGPTRAPALRPRALPCQKDFSCEPSQSPPRGRNLRGQDQGARRRPVADRARLWQGLHHAAGQEPESRRNRDGFNRFSGPRHRPWGWRPAPRPRGRDLRSRIIGQDHADAACDRRGAESRRRLRVRRRRTCAGSDLCAQTWRQPRGLTDFPAGYRRTGA